jgi:hypothetical protein
MGRYYSGDIEGKFMFAVQSSDAGERFNAIELEETLIEYRVNYESYQEIKKELDEILLTGAVARVEHMFENVMGYDDKTCVAYGVSGNDLSEYADYRLGKKILDFFDENPKKDCYFNAEI